MVLTTWGLESAGRTDLDKSGVWKESEQAKDSPSGGRGKSREPRGRGNMVHGRTKKKGCRKKSNLMTRVIFDFTNFYTPLPPSVFNSPPPPVSLFLDLPALPSPYLEVPCTPFPPDDTLLELSPRPRRCARISSLMRRQPLHFPCCHAHF